MCRWTIHILLLMVFTSCENDQKVVYSYYEDGSVLSMTETKSGLKEGYYKFYYENGNVEEEGTYSNDKRQGLVKKLNLDGSVKQELHYNKGMLVEQNDYWHNGKVRSLLYYSNNKVVDFLFYDSLGSRDLSWELVRALFESDRDTVKIGETYKALIRLGNRANNLTETVLNGDDSKGVLQMTRLPKFDSITSVYEVIATKSGNNRFEGVILDVMLDSIGNEKGWSIYPFKHEFFVDDLGGS